MYRVLLATAVALAYLLVSPAAEARTKRSSTYETTTDSAWSEPRRTTRRARTAYSSDEYSRSYRSSRSNRGWRSERSAYRSRGYANRSIRGRRVARSYDTDGEWGSETSSRRAYRSSQRARQRSARYASDGDDTGGLRSRAVTRYSGGGASRSCLQASAQALLSRIEAQFGPMQVISTCRPGARVAGSGRPSKHAFGLAVDFRVPSGRKAEVVRWLAANHHGGGVMTYRHSSHIHVDIGYPYRSFGGR